MCPQQRPKCSSMFFLYNSLRVWTKGNGYCVLIQNFLRQGSAAHFYNCNMENGPIFQEKSLKMGTLFWQNRPLKWVGCRGGGAEFLPGGGRPPAYGSYYTAPVNLIPALICPRGGRKRLPKFKFSAKFPIGLHVILQIQIKKIRKWLLLALFKAL